MYYFSPGRKAFNKTNKIWIDAVVCSDLRFEEISQELADGRVLAADHVGNPITLLPDTPVPPLSITRLFYDRHSQLNDDYEKTVAYLKSSYPLSEAITWAVQLYQAKIVMNWLSEDPLRDIADFPRSLAPFLYDLSTERTAAGIEGGLKFLAERVLLNDTIFTPAMAKVTARRHSAEKALIAAFDAEDRQALKNVTWSFNLEE